jgi:hypothetical protein
MPVDDELLSRLVNCLSQVEADREVGTFGGDHDRPSSHWRQRDQAVDAFDRCCVRARFAAMHRRAAAQAPVGLSMNLDRRRLLLGSDAGLEASRRACATKRSPTTKCRSEVPLFP